MDKLKNNMESSETPKQKRERSSNFSQQETDLLVSLVGEKKHIIENKKSNSTTWHEKEKAWKDIGKTFNSLSGNIFRDHKNLRLKYESIKRDIRKKSNVIRTDVYRTTSDTSGTAALTETEQKVREMIVLPGEGNDDSYDSDFIIPNPIVTLVSGEEESFQPGLSEKTSQDDSNIFIDTTNQDGEPPRKKVCNMSQEAELMEDTSDNESLSEKFKKTRKYSVKQKEKPALDPLTQEKLEVAKIQKRIAIEELEHRLLQREMLEKELEHKDVMNELEKQHLLLKIKLLKKELGN